MYSQVIPVIKKYDEALIKADLAQNVPLLQLSPQGLIFSLYNQQQNKFLSIETIELDPNCKIGEAANIFKSYISGNEYLGHSYQSVKVFLETNQSTLVPSPLFIPDELEGFAQFNFPVDDQDKIFHGKLRNLDAYIVYTFPEPLVSIFSETLKQYKYFSHSGTFIESLLVLNKNQKNQTTVYVNVRKSFLDITILNNQKLLFFNTFKYTTKEDFIYFVIYVMEQLQLNPEEVELVPMGMIERNSGLFETIIKYVRNVRFQSKIDKFNYSYIFNELTTHKYINLLLFEMCES